VDAATERVLAEQRDYYSARAGEYEDWWFRRGRYDHDVAVNARWFADVARAEQALARFAPAGRVLELACGTGLWTEKLAGRADALTAVDASAEVLALAQGKVPAANVEWVRADVFAWEPAQRYDVCFFSFWLSHVPGELAGRFWAKVARALAPGGRAFLIDSAVSERATARDHQRPRPGEHREARRLEDGREFRIVKHWFDARSLQRSIEQLGWSARIEGSEFFVYGEASPPRGS
jgi:demethylmenaquinone methyltransferase/2-methoxy-6-polyprenyl-1,4-benzoquinol methylase